MLPMLHFICLKITFSGSTIYNDFQRGFRTAIGMLCRSPAKELCNCNATEVAFLLGQILVRALQQSGSNLRRDGRVAEGGGLLNRCRVKSSTGGSNPPLSASNFPIFFNLKTNIR